MNEKQASKHDKEITLRAKLDDLTARLEHVYGPVQIMLAYEQSVTAHQLENVYDDRYGDEKTLSQKGDPSSFRKPSPIYNGFWDVDTLIIPIGAGDFKVWLWGSLDGIVKDYAKDWQLSDAHPDSSVLINKKVEDKRALEVQPDVWVIEVDVIGSVLGCKSVACDPDFDAGDIIMVAPQLLEGVLAFKIIPNGINSSEVRRFCGAVNLSQQFHVLKERIMECWPTTRRLQGDTDVSFRGVTRKTTIDLNQQRFANGRTKGQNQNRDEQIYKAHSDRGLSVSRLALEFKLTERRVSQIIAQEKQNAKDS